MFVGYNINFRTSDVKCAGSVTVIIPEIEIQSRLLPLHSPCYPWECMKPSSPCLGLLKCILMSLDVVASQSRTKRRQRKTSLLALPLSNSQTIHKKYNYRIPWLPMFWRDMSFWKSLDLGTLYGWPQKTKHLFSMSSYYAQSEINLNYHLYTKYNINKNLRQNTKLQFLDLKKNFWIIMQNINIKIRFALFLFTLNIIYILSISGY